MRGGRTYSAEEVKARDAVEGAANRRLILLKPFLPMGYGFNKNGWE